MVRCGCVCNGGIYAENRGSERGVNAGEMNGERGGMIDDEESIQGKSKRS